jgi:hypothetical protein
VSAAAAALLRRDVASSRRSGGSGFFSGLFRGSRFGRGGRFRRPFDEFQSTRDEPKNSRTISLQIGQDHDPLAAFIGRDLHAAGIAEGTHHLTLAHLEAYAARELLRHGGRSAGSGRSSRRVSFRAGLKLQCARSGLTRLRRSIARTSAIGSDEIVCRQCPRSVGRHVQVFRPVRPGQTKLRSEIRFWRLPGRRRASRKCERQRDARKRARTIWNSGSRRKHFSPRTMPCGATQITPPCPSTCVPRSGG